MFTPFNSSSITSKRILRGIKLSGRNALNPRLLLLSIVPMHDTLHRNEVGIKEDPQRIEESKPQILNPEECIHSKGNNPARSGKAVSNTNSDLR
jgi:hypothetical protein